ncbi:MAG: hypothetical protein FJ096_12795 [Deltaproteobacteria bacterium]|nr:hypothetical protein [Deltaproteobacteria bacterium]
MTHPQAATITLTLMLVAGCGSDTSLFGPVAAGDLGVGGTTTVTDGAVTGSGGAGTNVSATNGATSSTGMGPAGSGGASSTSVGSTTSTATGGMTTTATASTSVGASSSVAGSSSVVASSSVAASSSSGGGVNDMLPCGNAGTCDQVCCYGFQQSCADSIDKCKGLQSKMDCNDTTDCGMGEVCCATLMSGTWQSKCSTTCKVGPTTFRLCTDLAECGAGVGSCGTVPGALFPPNYMSCNK